MSITNSTARQVERKARDGRIRARINEQIVKPNGSTCSVWVGAIDRVTGSPVVRVESDRPGRSKTVYVKNFLRRDIDKPPAGAWLAYRTIPECGLGTRCVAVEHQVIHREYPWERVAEWITKDRLKRTAANAAATA